MSSEKQNTESFETVFDEISREARAQTIALIEDFEKNPDSFDDSAKESYGIEKTSRVKAKTDSGGKISESSSRYTAGVTIKCRFRVVSPTGPTNYSGKISSSRSSFSFDNLPAGQWTEYFNLRTSRFSRTRFEFSLSTNPALRNTDITFELDAEY